VRSKLDVRDSTPDWESFLLYQPEGRMYVSDYTVPPLEPLPQ
jgi:hypothetical protein